MIIIYTTYINIYILYINENFAINKIYLESLKSRMGTMLLPSATNSLDSNFERERQGDIGNRVNWFHGAVCLFTRCIDSPEQVPPGRPTSPPRIVVQPRPRPRPCWPLTTSRKPLQARSMSPFQLDPYCRPFLQQTVCHVIREKSFQGISQSGFLGRAIFEVGKFNIYVYTSKGNSKLN